jgi:hypothetical protein
MSADYKLEMKANSCFSKASERVYSVQGLLSIPNDWLSALGPAPGETAFAPASGHFSGLIDTKLT